MEAYKSVRIVDHHYWYINIHNSIITIHNSHMNSHKWFFRLHAPSAVHEPMIHDYDLHTVHAVKSTYVSSILCLWNHTMCLRCFALTCKLKWDFDYNSSCFQRVCIVKRSCYNQNLISVCTLNQSSGGISCGFTNIKSNWNMSRSDWNCYPVHKYWLNHSKWTFPTYITEWARYVFSQGGRMGYPAWA